ncbi:MAG: PSD1 domain-containing protein [Planctomycetaceae bacterium]|nr:PSD1 domain-containing protein [Planctomycetaceae bacterium]
MKSFIPKLLMMVMLVLAGDRLLCETAVADEASPAAMFHEQVEPLLRKRCYGCHSHSAGTIEGGLALDWRSGWERGGDRGAVIVPGNPDESLLIRAIRHEDPELQMPAEKLSPDEIRILEEWVRGGAFDDRLVAPAVDQDPRDWWSLKPLPDPKHHSEMVPEVEGFDHPIDAFVVDRLHREGLELSEPAGRRALIRRLYYDLTGLPPDVLDVQDFVDTDNGSTFEELVDRLLESPDYGERWARHWLDAIHFADSHGYEHDVGRDNAWRFRDYVIQSLNTDTSWPRFIREQLAADVFFPDQTQLIPALGFLGAGTFDLSTYSTAPVTFAYLDRDDLVTQTMSAFMSTTANCARCHAHKFDPVTQEDYYSLQAVFAGIVKGDVPFDPNPETARQRKEMQSLAAAARAQDAGLLLAEHYQPLLTEWLSERNTGAEWVSIRPEVFVSTGGATLSLREDSTIIAGGPAPDTDIYTVSGVIDSDDRHASSATSESGSPPNNFRATGLKLELFPDESLPMNGPGRCHNGNLHLTEVRMQLFPPGAAEAIPVPIRRATADFNQDGWGVERVLDGDPKTAWGIYPKVGEPHHAVFEFEAAQSVSAGTRIVVTLKQLHGGSHLIGCFRLSLTDASVEAMQALPVAAEQALSLPESQRTPEQQLAIASYALRQVAEQRLSQLPPQESVYAAAASVTIPTGNGGRQMAAIPSPKAVHVLERGRFDKPLREVTPGALAVLEHLPARFSLPDGAAEGHRRAALADWMVHPDNVLTWRSIVNRVWHYHFGRGLCDTPGDFGRMGGVPSHPELLDWLAVWFREEARGSLKQLHRLIVTSQVYRQSSDHRPEAAAVDADNRLLWRQNRHRLDADAYRDFVLSASGRLDRTIGGPAVQHFSQRKGPQATPELDYAEFDWSSASGAGRRSIYRYVWRGIADPFMEALDFPDLGLLAPVRGFSASPLQALALYNNDFVISHSEAMAERIQQQHSETGEQMEFAVRLAWHREATETERSTMVEFVRKHGLAAFCRVLLNSNEFLFVD